MESSLNNTLQSTKSEDEITKDIEQVPKQLQSEMIEKDLLNCNRNEESELKSSKPEVDMVSFEEKQEKFYPNMHAQIMEVEKKEEKESIFGITQKNCEQYMQHEISTDFIVTEPNHHKEWRTFLTKGLTSLKKIGYPGQALAFGMNAAVIIVGDTVNDVLLVAGQVGNGRVVLATHTDYANYFVDGENPDQSVRTLQNNIKQWLSRGIYQNQDSIMEAEVYLKTTDNHLLEFINILCFTEYAKQWTEQEKTRILNFVKNGGGLFVASTPWGWSQEKGSDNFNQMLTYKTLLQTGITITTDYIHDSTTFYFDKETYLSHLSYQIDATLESDKSSFNKTISSAILDQASFLSAEMSDKIKQKIKKYLPFQEIESISPSQQTPTESFDKKNKLICYQAFFLNGDYQIAAPKHEKFPGTVDHSASNFEYVTRDFTFTAPGFQQFHHTGLYAVAGQSITVEVLSDLSNKQWSVYIGFHLDNNTEKQSWIRWPKIYNKRKLTKSITFSCGLGGMIVLESPDQSNETIKIRVSHAVEAPWYDSQDKNSIINWQTRKNAPGAWGCVRGKWVGFCTPRASFQNIDPLQILNNYDRIYEQYHKLRGTRPENYRKIYIIADIDPIVGYMHSGYPIVTSMDVVDSSHPNFQFNYTRLTAQDHQGHWGFFHQIGHNMQRNRWTPSGTGEVTVNIFSLKAVQTVIGKTPKYAPWLNEKKEQAQKYLQNPNYDTWKENPEIALFVYAQVIENYGWDSMRNVLTSYETGNSITYPKSSEKRIDLFWSKYSLEVKVNLSELLNKWAIPFTADFTSKVAHLPPYVEKVNLFDP